MASDIEVIQQFYTSLNRNDVDAVVKLLDENIVRSEFEGAPGAGTFRGIQELRNHIISGRSTCAEGACEPVEFFPNGHKTVVLVHVKVRLKENPNWIDGQVSDGFALKDGKITEFHSFTSSEKAFAWSK